MQLSKQMEGTGVFGLIADELAEVRKLIDKQLSDGVDTVKQNAEILSGGGGKMLRPALVLLSGASCGKINDKHIKAAAIIEMIHNATLLHDDVIDEGEKRRGLPTINFLEGNEAAVMYGDFLLSRVFEMCADMEPRVFKLIAQATKRTCEGELVQLSQRVNWQLDESKYIEIIKDKTASLFQACCESGAILAGATDKIADSLAVYGLNLGIAFQIIDDLLDIIGNEEIMGKNTGTDINKHKITLAIIHLLSISDAQERKNLERKLDSLTLDKSCRTRVVEMLNLNGSVEYVSNKARDFTRKAISALDIIKDSQAKKDLITIAGFGANRNS